MGILRIHLLLVCSTTWRVAGDVVACSKDGCSTFRQELHASGMKKTRSQVLRLTKVFNGRGIHSSSAGESIGES
jgi:hypothetical protein